MTWNAGSPVEIRTERYLIRSAVPGDVNDVYLSWFSDAQTLQFIGPDLARMTRDEHVAVVSSTDNHRRILLVAEDHADGQLVGWMRVQVEPRHKRAQTSIVIGDKGRRERGAMLEIHKAVRLFLFADAGIQKLTFSAYGAHTLMLEHLERDKNVVKEGVLRKHEWLPGLGWQDVHVYAMFRDPLEPT